MPAEIGREGGWAGAAGDAHIEDMVVAADKEAGSTFAQFSSISRYSAAFSSSFFFLNGDQRSGGADVSGALLILALAKKKVSCHANRAHWTKDVQ